MRLHDVMYVEVGFLEPMNGAFNALFFLKLLIPFELDQGSIVQMRKKASSCPQGQRLPSRAQESGVETDQDFDTTSVMQRD